MPLKFTKNHCSYNIIATSCWACLPFSSAGMVGRHKSSYKTGKGRGKKEKSTFTSWQLSCNRRISCTATFTLHFSDTFVAGIGKERQKLKQNHLRSMHWTASNLSILYYTKQWRQNWSVFQGTVLQAVRIKPGFSGRSLFFFKKNEFFFMHTMCI